MKSWQQHKVKAYLIGAAIVAVLIFSSLINLSLPHAPRPVAMPVPTITSPLAIAKCHAVVVNSHDSQAVEPDVKCTPGQTNPAVTQATIYTTICKSGYTESIRPSVAYTDALKVQSIKDYGYTNTNVKDYEEDHFLPLELGGSPTSPQNLWAEPGKSPNEKDLLENYLRAKVCSGAWTLQQAQGAMVTDWYKEYQVQQP